MLLPLVAFAFFAAFACSGNGLRTADDAGASTRITHYLVSSVDSAATAASRMAASSGSSIVSSTSWWNDAMGSVGSLRR